MSHYRDPALFQIDFLSLLINNMEFFWKNAIKQLSHLNNKNFQ